MFTLCPVQLLLGLIQIANLRSPHGRCWCHELRGARGGGGEWTPERWIALRGGGPPGWTAGVRTLVSTRVPVRSVIAIHNQRSVPVHSSVRTSLFSSTCSMFRTLSGLPVVRQRQSSRENCVFPRRVLGSLHADPRPHSRSSRSCSAFLSASTAGRSRDSGLVSIGAHCGSVP